jgi:hypothetical protein
MAIAQMPKCDGVVDPSDDGGAKCNGRHAAVY